jgi:hypothetical protein
MGQTRIWGIFSLMRSSNAHASRFGRAQHRLGAVTLAVFALGCSAEAQPGASQSSPSVWVGAVQGTEVKVALVDRNGAVELFFCGGPDSYATKTRWFAEGAMRADPFSFTSGGWTVEGVVREGGASGSVQAASDAPAEWTATVADPATIAGLYEGDAPCGKLGLIVTQLTAEDEPTGQGACLQVEGERVTVEQVNPVRFAQRSAKDEISVTVASAPDERFTVRPVTNVAP